MKIIYKMECLLLALCIFSSCASSIVDGEYFRTSSTIYAPKPENTNIEVFLKGRTPDRPTINVGRVTSRAYVLEKGMEKLKEQARKLGADAILAISYERKFSADYFQDLYFIDGDAVKWE